MRPKNISAAYFTAEREIAASAPIPPDLELIGFSRERVQMKLGVIAFLAGAA